MQVECKDYRVEEYEPQTSTKDEEKKEDHDNKETESECAQLQSTSQQADMQADR